MTSATSYPERQPLRWRLPRVSPAAAFGIRLATGASAAIWIGHAPGLVTNESQWILITVLMVAQPNTGGSLLKGVLRAVGTVAAAFTAIFLFGWFAQDPALLLAGLLLVQAIAAYGFTGPRFQYAWFVWAFTTAIVLGSAMSGSEHVETLAFQRATMVGIGVLIVFVLDSTLWPDRSEATLRKSLAERATQLATSLSVLLEGSSEARAEKRESSPSPLANQLGLASALRAEIGVSASRAEGLSHAALLLEALASCERTLPSALEALPAQGPREELGRCVRGALEASAAALAENRAPTPRGATLDAALAETVDATAGPTGTAGEGIAGAAGAGELRSLVAALHGLEKVLGRLASRETKSRSAALPEGDGRSFRPDPLRVQTALRAAIAVGAVFVAMIALGWGINTMAAPVAFMLATSPTRGAATKLAVVVAGAVLFAWLVADLAIVTFYTEVGRIPAALAFPFFAAAALGYLRVSRPQVAAIVPLLALLLILPIFGGPGAPTDVYAPYSTACFVALSAAVAWTAAALLWPASAAALFRRRAAELLALCGRALSLDEPSERRRNAAALLGAFATQLGQVAPLHEQARHEPVESELDDTRRGELLALIQSLFDQSLRGRQNVTQLRRLRSAEETPAVAALLEALVRQDEALAMSIEAASRALGDTPKPPAPRLREAHDEVESRLEELRGRAQAGRRHGTDAILLAVAERNSLASHQLAIEAWLADWHAAFAAEAVA